MMTTRRRAPFTLLMLLLATSLVAATACDDDDGTDPVDDIDMMVGDADDTTDPDATDTTDTDEPDTDEPDTTDVTDPDMADTGGDMGDTVDPDTTDTTDDATDTADMGDTVDPPNAIEFDDALPATVAPDGTVDVAITGLTDGQAYRVTLVVADNLTDNGDGTGTFVDDDMNGAADAGASENVALITSVNNTAVDPGAKTVPGGDDDPMNPSGILPVNGSITLTLTGVGAGTVHPVAYENGGESTFLEIDENGAPIEVYEVGPALTVEDPSFDPDTDATIGQDETASYTVNGLDDGQAYRITLVVADNLTDNGDGTSTFIDDDMNGAADAGASENVALITHVNGMDLAMGAKTFPAGDDDPANPSAIFPVDGAITFDVTGVAGGTVYPVLYHNGGASTFLEIDMDGLPVELYEVGPAISVEDPTFDPNVDDAYGAGFERDFTITNLDDDQAYRITLVVADNLTTAGDGTATFVDDDMNGAADAGASENVALITSINGTPVVLGAKTVPDGMDDPANPTGVFPVDGAITLTITGEGPGAVYPVVYHNGGASTFLEIDASGVPTETYEVGPLLTIDDPTFDPATPQSIFLTGDQTFTISGLTVDQAYRITLVVGANVTPGVDGRGTFVDTDNDGAADAGTSENIALITEVNGMTMAGAKTVPSGNDDPANPTGIFPDANGEITLTISPESTGTVYPVIYHNGGASTFLEVDANGEPIEPYEVGPSLTVVTVIP